MEAKTTTDLYAERTEASSATMVMSSDYLLGVMVLFFLVSGSVLIFGACQILITPPENWPEFNYSWVVFLWASAQGLSHLYFGLLCSSMFDLRSITVVPGQATLVWRVFRTPLRSLSFDVRFVVVHQDLWRNGKGSTDRVILEGQDQTYTVATLWNMPPTGSSKPPSRNLSLEAGSELLPDNGPCDERTVSPLIRDLAKAIAAATSVPIIHRVGKSQRPWSTIEAG